LFTERRIAAIVVLAVLSPAGLLVVLRTSPKMCIGRIHSGFARDFDEHADFPLVIVCVIRNLDVLPRSVDLEAEPGLQAGELTSLFCPQILNF